MTANIEITGTPLQKLPVTLVGVKYIAKVPKKALAMALMMRLKNAGGDLKLLTEAIEAIITKVFGKAKLAPVLARLEDEDDELDIDHLVDLMNALIDYAAADPTTSPSDSPTTP